MCKQTSARMQARICKPTKGNVQQIRRPSPLKWLHLSPSLLASSLEHCIRVHPLLVPFIFLAPFLGRIPQVWQCLLYISCTLLGHTLGTLSMSMYFLAFGDIIMHNACIYIYTHTYIFASVCVGDRALWMMDPNGYMSDPFQSCVLLNLWHEYVLKEFFRTYIELVRTYVIQTWLIF